MYTQDEYCCLWTKKFVLWRMRNDMRVGKACIFDIGHNSGEFSTDAFRVFGKEIIIHAFEPNLDVNSIYENNSSVVMNRYALSSEKGESQLYIPVELSNQSEYTKIASLFNRPHFKNIKNTYVYSKNVNTTTLDHYCNEKNIDYIDYLKIDTEGHEFEILKGGKNIFSEKRVAAGQYEIGATFFAERGHTLDDIVEMLINYGYYSYLGEPISKNRLVPGKSHRMFCEFSNDGWENVIFIDSCLKIN